MLNEKIIAKYSAISPEKLSGKETAVQLNELHSGERKQIFHKHMKNSVHFPLFDGIIISAAAEIGEGTVIMPNTIISGAVKIGKNCVIGPNSYIEDSIIGDNCALDNTQCRQSLIKDNALIGPFVNIRPNTVIDNTVHLGNFTELKNSNIGAYTKISHLTYIGDSDVGERVNVGCGVVTVNFNGKDKYKTEIGDHAFIGCNTNLVAPVKIGKNAYTAAGSTVTEDIPDNSLVIARARQVVKENWVTVKKPYRDSK